MNQPASPILPPIRSDTPVAEGSAVYEDGSIQVPSHRLPFSELASKEARTAFIHRARHPWAFFTLENPTLQDLRDAADQDLGRYIEKFSARYRTVMTDAVMGGVYTQIFTPADGIAVRNEKRVLINVHGGAFVIGSRTASQVESIPIAAESGIKVISVDYGLAPEHRFPSASEDLTAVYREVLKTYRPENIGLFGVSAGGLIIGQAIPWFRKIGLPRPGAIGIFSAATRMFTKGDSAWLTPHLGGMIAAPREGEVNPYYAGADMDDPYVTPAVSPETLAAFPPTLIATATRAAEMSAAVMSHIELVKAGVDARLYVWDGLDHHFFIDPDIPESRDFYTLAARFFDETLGTG